MASASYHDIKDSLRQPYLDDLRQWLAGFSGGGDNTMVGSLVFDAVLSVPPHLRKNPVAEGNDEWRIPNDESVNPQSQVSKRQLHELPRVWVSNRIEILTTEEVWAYLLQRPNPRGNN